MKKQPFIFLALLIFLTIGALHSVTAGWETAAATTDLRNSQEDSQYSLTVTTAGAGSFTQEPQSNEFDSGTVITLTAVAQTGWSFADWSGDLITTTNPVTFTMDADKAITATFTINQYTLTVGQEGEGTITREPAGSSFDFDTTVTLTAASATGWSFAGWSGDLITTTNPVTFTMDADKAITATFNLNNYSVAVSVSPPEGGTVAGDGLYDHGQMVVITATANSGYSFIHWTEDGLFVSDDAIYTFLATDDHLLVANFSVDYGLLLTPNNAGSGNPGQTIIYTHTLTNTGPILDVFDIMVADGSFDAGLISTTPITLTAGTGATLSLTVTIPPDTPAGTEEITNVTVTSRADGSVTATVTNTTTVNATYGLLLEPDNSSSGNPGQTLVYTPTLTNQGNITNTFDLTSDSNAGFTAVLTPASPLSLPAGASATLTLTVTIPEDALAGVVDVNSVTATSQANGRVTGMVVNTTTVNPVYGLLVTPDNLGSGDPGQTIIYTHTLSNLGNATDAFSITVGMGSFEAELISATSIALPAGESATLTLTVAIPPGTAVGTVDATSITASSQTAPNLTDTAVNTTTVSAFYAVQLVPNNAHNGNPGQSLFYDHTLTNLGNVVDTYDLLASSSAGFEVEFHQTSTPITLQPVSSANVRVRVRVANEAAAGTIDITSVTATSRGDTNVSSTATNTTNVNAVYALLLTPDNARSGNPGQTLVYTHTLTNLANITDTFSLSVSSSADFDLDLISGTPITLPSGASATLTLTVAIRPDAAGDLIDVSSVTAVSQGNSNVAGTVTNTTTVNPIFGLLLAPDNASSGTPGQTVVYTHTLTNQANVMDTFNIVASSSAGFGTILGPLPPITIGAGLSTTLTLSVTIPAGTLAGTTDITSVTATSQTDTSVTGTAVNATTVNTVYGLLLTPDNQSAGNPGQTLLYSHTLTNRGNTVDTFDITTDSSAGFAVTLISATPVILLPGTSATIVLTVRIPEGAAAGTVDTTSVTATSRGTGNLSDTATNSTSVNPVYALLLAPDNNQSGVSGHTLVYTHTLTNLGNSTDTFAITTSGIAGFDVALISSTPVTLTAGASTTVELTVTIPPTTPGGTNDITSVTATSQSSTSVSGTAVNVTTAISPIYNPVLGPDNSGSGFPGQTVVYTHTVTNQGNTSDTFVITANSSAGFGLELAPAAPISLPIGHSATITLAVTIPPGTPASVVDTTTVTATSQGNISITDTATNTTSVNSVAGVMLTPALSEKEGEPGETVSHSFTLHNSGNATGTFTMNGYSSQSFVFAIEPISVTLPHGGSTPIVVAVTVPLTAAFGTLDMTIITATSTIDSAVTATAAAHTLVEENIPDEYQISGQVRDQQGNPVADVTISAGSDYSALTDSNGNYILSGLPAGSYTLTPGKSGYSFTPATLSVTVPPDAEDRDFTAVRLPSLVYLPMVQNNYISYFEGPWEVEPNNNSAQANGPLRSGRDYFGYPNDAYDFFSIYLTQPGQLNVTLTNHTGQGVQLQLFYQSTANRVGFVPNPPYTLSYDGQAGWYYIFIYTESGFNSTTPYTLQVTYP